MAHRLPQWKSNSVLINQMTAVHDSVLAVCQQWQQSVLLYISYHIISMVQDGSCPEHLLQLLRL